MEIAIKLAQFLLSLSLLIILHELGHFIPAKLFKTKVEKFYLFFDVKFSLFKKKIGETVYGIGWLPLGGYVKIAGMIDESMDTEAMKLPPQPWEFRSKPAWQRLIIMLGGVTVNFILAVLIYIGMAYIYGDTFIATKDLKDGIWVSNPVGEQLGFKNGDKIVKIDGKEVANFDDLSYNTLFAKDVTIERDGQVSDVKLPVDLIDKMLDGKKVPLFMYRIPFAVGGFSDESGNTEVLEKGDVITSINGTPIRYYDEASPIGEGLKNKKVPATIIRDEKEQTVTLTYDKNGKIGVGPAITPLSNLEKLGYYKVTRARYGFFEAFPAGIKRSGEEVSKYFAQLKAIFTPSTGAYKGVGGFYAIFDIFPNTWSWEAFWSITALLSIMLGVMNLLPIPALDGGHVMFLLYEMITGRKPGDKFMEYAQMAGFFILIALVLFANGNDIFKAFTK